VYGADIIQALGRAKPAADGRVYTKVFENQNITVWALRWTNNGTGIHDHVNSRAGVYVLDGTIFESQFVPPNSQARTRSYKSAETFSFGAPHVHTLYGQGDTLNIYSPPLREMTHYQVTTGGILVPTVRWKETTP
jgi:hypothetical protein